MDWNSFAWGVGATVCTELTVLFAALFYECWKRPQVIL